jgi:hypothetical protein
MPKANTSEIVLGLSSMEITRNPVAENSAELIPKVNISGVFPVKIQERGVNNELEWVYRFDKIIYISVLTTDDNHFSFDIQEITNQPGWTPDLAGQQQAIADINAWLQL